MPLVPSGATEADVAVWMEERCHHLAVALHRDHGWRIHLVLDEGEAWWTDPDDPEDVIPSVLHAYAVDPSGTAWDALGARPLAEVADECRARWPVSEYGSDELRSEAELGIYVGCWADDGGEPVDRPLTGYDEDGIEEARAFAETFLADLDGFPAARTPAR